MLLESLKYRSPGTGQAACSIGKHQAKLSRSEKHWMAAFDAVLGPHGLRDAEP